MSDMPLAILAFDHRAEFSRSVFGSDPEHLPEEQRRRLSAAKSLVFDAFLTTLPHVVGVRAGVLVDEEFGGEVAERCRGERDFLLAMPVEKADQGVFSFEYGADWAEHLRRFGPDAAKALVRLNAHDDPVSIATQLERLRELSDALRDARTRFVLELIVSPSTDELLEVGDDLERWEDELRPAAVRASMALVQDAGIRVSTWKLQGVATEVEAVATAAQARRVGDANCIVLGAAAVPERVAKWLRVAAATDGFHGFAIGRNIWRDALQRWVRDEISRDDAIAVIARGYLSTIAVYTGGRA